MKVLCYTELENDTWYWFNHHSENDVFAPVYVNNDTMIVINDKQCSPVLFRNLDFYKAIMPNDNITNKECECINWYSAGEDPNTGNKLKICRDCGEIGVR